MSSIDNLDRRAYLSWVEVNLEAIRSNYHTVRRQLAPGVELFPVVKADAYGHGAVPAARVFQSEGALRICVARVEEAQELRDSGIDLPILVFAPPMYHQALVAANAKLEIVVSGPEHLKAVAAAQTSTGKPVVVHIKADVGMGRIGAPPSQILALLQDCRTQNILVRGIMSHFPCADASDASITLPMIEKFRVLKEQINASDPTNRFIFHISNSAAALRFPEAGFDAVRSGIALYGQRPSVDVEYPVSLTPAMSLKTRIVFIKDVPADTPISYCQTYRTSAPARIATLALGYADGYPRHASGKTRFLLHEKYAPQVGRVCMDQLMIDVTGIPEASLGDEVLAFGTSPSGDLRAEDVADLYGSIGYELTTRIGKRLPRFFS